MSQWYFQGRWLMTLGAIVGGFATGGYWIAVEGALAQAVGVAIGAALLVSLGFGLFWFTNKRLLAKMGLRF